MAGNHDEWLCSFYRDELGATVISEPHDITLYGRRLRVVHGHLLGARHAWKAWMESRAFFEAFSYLPGPIALTLDRVLAWRNARGLDADEERHLSVYRAYAEKLEGSADLVIFGHVHRPVDLALTNMRLIILGGWQRRSSFLKIDESGASFSIEHGPDQNQEATPVHRPLESARNSDEV
jgi:UDP-2,3-diacylglucosamine hydrolase